MPPRKSTKRKADAENLPVRAKDEASPAPKPAAQGTLQVFDSDDEGEEFAAATTLSAVEKPAVIKDSEEESESDDDDAPEAEGTAHVVSKAEMAAQSAKEAAQEKAAEEKRKRQQRDALLKQQASERKTKKAVQESTDQAGRRRKSRSLKTSSLLGQAPNSDSESDDEDELERQAVSNTLDEQFLDSDSEDGSPDPDAMDIDSFGETRPKQRKVSAIEQRLTRLDRAPRDERVGSTVYRVEKKRDDRLAPKVRKHARGTKGALLARGRAPVKSKGGFFKNGQPINKRRFRTPSLVQSNALDWQPRCKELLSAAHELDVVEAWGRPTCNMTTQVSRQLTSDVDEVFVTTMCWNYTAEWNDRLRFNST